MRPKLVWRTVFVAVFLLALAVALAGCGGVGGGQGGGPSESGLSGQIVLYTSEPQENADETVAAFNEQYPEIEVQVFRSGTGELLTRIESEEAAGGVQADVLLAADAPTFENLKSRDLFVEYTPAGAEELAEEFKDPDGFYTGTRLISTIIGYNTEQVQEPPSSWQDLLDSLYQAQRIGMPSPDYSGAAAYNIALWYARPELGAPFVEGLAAQQPTVVEGNGQVREGLANGQFPVGVIIDYMVRDLEQQGSPVSGVFPEEGVPVITEPVAIFESSENREAAQAFADFLVSREGQELAASQNYVPIVPGVEPPEGAPSLDEIDILEGDLQQFVADQDAAKERFNQLLESS
jgi:iron(III) transport system substrate-binding protein